MNCCVGCQKDFQPYGPEQACSIKCKLIAYTIRDENGCWIWQRNLSGGRYGKLRWRSKWISTHRASYEQFIGKIEPGKVICHSCDVMKCANPEHLFMGTRLENMKDALEKGRLKDTALSFVNKFTDDQINEIRKLKKEGFPYSRLRRIFNTSDVYLHKVVKNKLRKEVDAT